MTDKTLYLLTDTNLFVQCRALEELDWSRWAEFAEVHLIVSRPVYREIDNQKNKGGDRLGKRARKTSTLFREIINSDEKHKVVCETGPRVMLCIKPEYVHSPSLADILNYDERDDQLVGTAHAYAKDRPGDDVRLLTHDTGPMATGPMVGVIVELVPEDWLLPPENSAAETTIAGLQNELERLKKAEPEIQVICLDKDDQEIDKLECEIVRYEALTDDELAELMARIKDSFPPETDFGPREVSERQKELRGFNLMGTEEVFTPATEEEISTYREEEYSAWLEKCESVLKGYFFDLTRSAGLPRFAFVASNEGTRPAKDVLVKIETRGNFQIVPPPKRDDDNDDDEKSPENSSDKVIELPRPPSAPKGIWEPKHGFSGSFGGIGAMMRGSDPLFGRTHLLDHDFPLTPLLHEFKIEHDPNAFYWKPEYPNNPVSSFTLTCSQWRHAIDSEYFEGNITFAWEEDTVEGLLECRIHAENLSESVVKKIPVRIRIEHRSSFERASALVDFLCGSESG